MHLLQDDVWAVRQEGPTALEYLVENAILSPLYEEENRRVKLLREGSKTSRFFERKGSSSSFTSLASMGGSRTSRNFEGGDEKNEVKKKEKEDGAVSIALAREAILIDRLIPILDELAQDKRYFVRGETCRYILAIYRYFSPSVWKHQLSPLLERIAQDEVPQARYAAAKAVEILELQASQRGEIEGDDSSCVSTSATTTTSPKEDFFLERSWIDAMKKKFLQDEDEDVASVFSPPFDDE
ncbi:heat repeat-containing protein [Cystoisospora suis]|uniref:Heat repeat-containing protein n=1 Tax=Cystoisospora suis TaxID=483139 RepID=A0A2C6KP63_9APIC|nr:heat repeat-containing protein [Cystoisospora suis]